jgi:hypothetical protein
MPDIIAIEGRCNRRDTWAFVAAENVDMLAEKLVGIIGDRRMTKVHRYLGESAGTPTVRAGLWVNRGAPGEGVNRHPGRSVGIYLAGSPYLLEAVSLAAYVDGETEEQAAEKYHHPEKQWLGQRRNITRVELRGWPGQPSREDSIRIEYWNEHGVGQETLVAFDDYSPIQEIAWDVKGDRERRVWMYDAFCDTHGLHFEHPDHKSYGCEGRRSTRAEDLEVLAVLARLSADPALELDGVTR